MAISYVLFYRMKSYHLVTEIALNELLVVIRHGAKL